MKKALAVVMSLILVAIMGLAGCSEGGSDSSTESVKPAESVKPTESDKTTESSTTDNAKVDPLEKYNTPITINVARYIDPTVKFEDGVTIDNNVWTQGYQDILGINLKTAWLVQGTADAYNQKMTLSLASGSLPDMFYASNAQFSQLAQSGQLADLTDAYNKYASPLLKEVMNQKGPDVFKTATFNGKLVGLPVLQGGESYTILYIRSDWMNKLGLQPPKTMDDVFKISDSFTNQDPDGNGKKDTYGMAFSKSLHGDPMIMDGFYNAFNSYPSIWLKDSNGNLVYGDIQPETKTVLAKLHEMYMAGEIDQEFGTKDWIKVAEDLIAGKVGMFFGPSWAPANPLIQSTTKDPNADWKAYPLPPAVDSQPVKFSAGFPVSNYYMVRKGFSNPEALIKMANYQLEIQFGANSGKEVQDKYVISPTDQNPIFKYAFTGVGPFIWLQAYKNVQKVIDGKTAESELSDLEKPIYDQVTNYMKTGDLKDYIMYKSYELGGPFTAIDQYVANHQDLVTAFYGQPTPTMVKSLETLKKLQVETFTQIIMGAAPISDFDKFVDNWKKLGGEQITQEVNDWHSKNK